MYDYKAAVSRVVDGDTLDVTISLGFDVRIGQTVRVYGVNTPEVVGTERAAGLTAKEFVERLLPPGTPVRLQTVKPREKWGRYLAIVTYQDGAGVTRSLADTLIAQGLGEPYYGGPRK